MDNIYYRLFGNYLFQIEVLEWKEYKEEIMSAYPDRQYVPYHRRFFGGSW